LDLFQFFVALSIPFAVVGMGAYFTASQAQDTALQSYLDGMAKLVIDNDLANSKEGDEVRTVAQARTSTVLSSLDPQHKRSVLEFLQSSNLIGASTPVVQLFHADLSDANLIGANLSGANLSGADLSGADLRGANLRGVRLNDTRLRDANLFDADLSEANLEHAQVTDEQLAEAKSLKGATMRDGSVHD